MNTFKFVPPGICHTIKGRGKVYEVTEQEMLEAFGNLRDYFAATAPYEIIEFAVNQGLAQSQPRARYQYADAMLVEREKTK